MNNFKISLAAARVNSGMTQDAVAEALHVSKTTVGNWEKGKTIPSLATISVLSSIYKIPADNIFLPKEST